MTLKKSIGEGFGRGELYDVLSDLTTDVAGLTTDVADLTADVALLMGEIPYFVTATITTTWTGSSPPYTQDISIEGITADHKPIISPVYSDTLETAIAQQEAWNLIDKIVTDEDKITCYCFTDKPEVEIPIQIWVV